MSSNLHERDHLRAVLKPGWRHFRQLFRDSSYRALLRFARQTRRVPRRTPGSVRFGGRPIQFVDAASLLSAWDEIFVNRIYDIPPPTSSPLLIDVGANIGLAAIRWKQLWGELRYLGFEPDPMIAHCCRANLATWKVAGELRNCAVGGSPGIAAFQPDGADSGRIVGSPVSASVQTVPVEILSRFLDQPVDLLKIDIEGSEGEVIHEIAPHLAQVRYLCVEWHDPNPSGHTLGSTLQLLEASGFFVTVRVVQGPRFPFRPSRIEGFRQQLNLFAVRG